jgi:Predicted phosphoesterases, related to the Icc protein
MLALVFGDLHGCIRAMYSRAADWSRQNDVEVDVILQVGDLGVYPVPDRQEEEKKTQYGPGDYAKLAAEGWEAPIPTYFCKGNNEDFEALNGPLLPGLHYMPDGTVQHFGSTRIAFIGGAWSRKTFEGRQFKPKHFTHESLERLNEQEFDIVLSHEAPSGLWFPGRTHAVGAPPLRQLILEKQPRLFIHGHHHQAMQSEIGQTKVISLCRFSPRSPMNRCMMPLEL